MVVQIATRRGQTPMDSGRVSRAIRVQPFPCLPVYQGFVVNSQRASDAFLWTCGDGGR